MVRDGAAESITHNRETRTASIKWNKQPSSIIFDEHLIEHVERVVYINDQTGNEWKDDGLQVQELQKRLSDILLETGWLRDWADSLDRATVKFVEDIRHVLGLYHGEIPEDMYDRMDGIIKKAYDVTSSKLYQHGDESIYEKWKEQHRANSWAESDITASLHDTIEAQAAEIRELKQRVEEAERQANQYKVLYRAAISPDEEFEEEPEEKKSWWHRWLNI